MGTSFDDVEDLPQSGIEWVLENPVEAIRILADVQPGPELLAALASLGASWNQTQGARLLPWYDQWPYNPKTEGPEWEPTSWLINDVLPSGAVTLLAGPGSAGKTHVAVQLAVNCALGNERAWLGTTDLARKLDDHGPVVWVTWETKRGDYQKRLLAACAGNELAELRGKLAFVDFRDEGSLFASLGRGAPPEMTACGQELLSRAAEYHAKLLVLDPAAGAYGGNENARSEVRGFLSRLARGQQRQVVRYLSLPILRRASAAPTAAAPTGKVVYSPACT